MMVRRITDDRGAVAITVAILAIVLFGIGALAVDLGNMAYKRSQAQSAADFAALAGGSQLPNTAAATTEAIASLQANAVGEWGDTSLWSVGQFSNGDPIDGEITFASNNTQMTVRTPTAQVSFGLAGALGRSSGPVAAAATSAIRSPGRILPFFLPVDCSLGQQTIKAGAQAPAEPTPVFNPDSGNGNSVPGLDTNTSLQAPLDTSGTNAVRTVITVYGDSFSSLAGTNVYFTRGDSNIKVDLDANTTQITPTAAVLDPLPDPNAFVDNSGNNQNKEPDELRVTVPDAVDTVSGTWFIRVENNAGISKSQPISQTVALTVLGGANLADQCGEKLTGDFGYLDSPRADSGGGPITQAQGRLDLNISQGLDHDVTLFTGTLPAITLQDNCRTQPGNIVIPGGQLDEFSTRNGANCPQIFNGNKVDAATDGLILGGTAAGIDFDGRLDAPPSPGCNYQGGSNPRSFLGVDINNDVLSCFVRPGYKVADVIAANPRSLIVDPTQVSNGLLTPEVLESPRFFVVPIIHFNVNPPNGFYPIVGFRGVFITDENPNAAPGSSTATADNGLTASNSKLETLTVQAFDLSALPDVVVDSDGGIPYLGSGPKLVRLIA